VQQRRQVQRVYGGGWHSNMRPTYLSYAGPALTFLLSGRAHARTNTESRQHTSVTVTKWRFIDIPFAAGYPTIVR